VVPPDVAAYLAKAVDAARGPAEAGDGAAAKPPPRVPEGLGAMELLVRRGELLARTASVEARAGT